MRERADADRLRAAADKVERLAGQMVEEAVSPGVSWGTDIILGQLQVAALLRAVADQRGETGPLTRCPDCDGVRGAHEEWCVWGSALALADAILVGQDATEALR